MSGLDIQNVFDEKATKLTSGASTNYLNINIKSFLAVKPLYFVSRITTAMTDSGNDSTLSLRWETDDNSSFSSPTTLQEFGVFAAQSPIGTIIQVPLAIVEFQKYNRIYYTVANGDLTTCALTSLITPSVVAVPNYGSNPVLS